MVETMALPVGCVPRPARHLTSAFLACACAAAGLCWTPVAHAANAPGLVVIPRPASGPGLSYFKLSLKPAQAGTAGAIELRNPGPRRLRDVEGGNGLSTPGLFVRWIYYRGPGPVSLSPETDASGDQKLVTSTTKATFRVPGVYVLRAIASDGSLSAFHDVAVTVK